MISLNNEFEIKLKNKYNITRIMSTKNTVHITHECPM